MHPSQPGLCSRRPDVWAGLLLTLLLGIAAGRTHARVTTNLVNGGFEEAQPTNGWELHVYGAAPKLALDTGTFHAGRQALRIEADEPSDTALGQELQLRPNGWHRFGGMVRTRALDPRGSDTSATLQVQRPQGAGLITSGASHRGDTGWTPVATYFQAPPDGRVRLCLFFVGFGKGTGTVWFDQVQLEEIDLAQGEIRVASEPLVAGEISPLQYGQFVEYLCDLVPAMWAEKIYDGGFEGLSAYKFAFIKETDFQEKPWYPTGAVNRGRYALDRSAKISGETSQKIEVREAVPCTLGLAQDGIYVDPGQALDLQCWLKVAEVAGPVRWRLHQEGRIYARGEFQPGPDWRKFTTRLTPAGRDANATLAFEFRGPGTLWLDNVSLRPVDTVGGWRRDVVEAVRALKPGVIRFGGSALDEPSLGEFNWQDTIGDPDRRRPFRAWGGLQPTGPGLEEFVQFCQAVGAEPLICVRCSQRTPRDAAGEVEYFNGSTNTPMGAWRARNGHPEPYRVRFWQVGNELSGSEYEAQAPGFCAAMKAADPSIRLFSSFPTAGLLRQAGQYFDYVCPHHYTPDLAASESSLATIARLIQENAPGRNIKVAVTEWNTTAGDMGLGRAKLMTLENALACARYHNLLHRHCGLVEIANRSNLINSFGSGILHTDNHRLYRRPTYHAQQLYATLAGRHPLRIHSEYPVNTGLDLSATRSREGAEVALFVVNYTLQELARTVDFSAFGRSGQTLTVHTLADRDQAGEPDAQNSFGDPDRVAARASTHAVGTPRFTYRFPALSLTVLTWHVEK